MRTKPKNYYNALATMIGYIIGVGMFGLPYIVAKAGLVTFLILLAILVPLQYLLHLIYANVILVTDDYHRMPGYAGVYFGSAGKKLITVAKLVGNYGALLAYIIITGIFLQQLLAPLLGGSVFVYATALFAIEAVIIYFGIGMIARTEFFMTILLLAIVVMIAAKGWGAISLSNFPLLDWKYLILPYGAMLFSLDGTGALPMVARLLNKDKESMKSIVRVGTLLSAAVIVTFVLVIVGVSGRAVTQDALTGIKSVLGDGVVLFALVFGVLTMVTSFFGVAESLREMFWWDFKMNQRWAWALAVFVPYIFYVIGVKNLIDVISFAGAVAGGISAIVMVMIFLKLKKTKDKLVLFNRTPANALIYLFICMFIGGIFYQIYFFLVKYLGS